METGHNEMREKPEGEHRRNVRFYCSWFVCSCTVIPEFRPCVPNNSKKRGALLLNICLDGICFETNFAPSIGSSMQLHIHPIEGPEVKAKIRVMHKRSSAKNGFYIIHSEFSEVSGRNRQNLLILLDTISRLQEDLKPV